MTPDISERSFEEAIRKRKPEEYDRALWGVRRSTPFEPRTTSVGDFTSAERVGVWGVRRSTPQLNQ